MPAVTFRYLRLPENYRKCLQSPSDICGRQQMTPNACRNLQIFEVACK
jgi:hypothetical protein